MGHCFFHIYNSGDPSLFTAVADNTLLPFGQNLIAQGEDSSEKFDISEIFEDGLSFGNRTFMELFVHTNGGVSFLDTLSRNETISDGSFTIAPFGDDLDNRALPPPADPGIFLIPTQTAAQLWLAGSVSVFSAGTSVNPIPFSWKFWIREMAMRRSFSAIPTWAIALVLVSKSGP